MVRVLARARCTVQDAVLYKMLKSTLVHSRYPSLCEIGCPFGFDSAPLSDHLLGIVHPYYIAVHYRRFRHFDIQYLNKPTGLFLLL